MNDDRIGTASDAILLQLRAEPGAAARSDADDGGSCDPRSYRGGSRRQRAPFLPDAGAWLRFAVANL